MTDILDFCLADFTSLQDSLNQEQIYSHYHFDKHVEYSDFRTSQTSISDCLHEVQQIECYQKCIPFSNFEFWNYKLLLLIKHISYQICTEIKILSPKGEVLKVVSQYHRTFLYRRFSQKNMSITPKINPQTGEISLCNAFLFHKIKTHQQHEIIVQNLFTSVTEHEDQIVQIINLIENKEQQVPLVNNKQNHTNIPAFVRMCSKKSNKQNKKPFQDENQQNFEFQRRKEFKSRTYGGQDANPPKRNSKSKQMTKYLNNPLQSIDQIWQYDNLNLQSPLFKRQVKNILGSVQNSLIRKDTPLKNFEILKLPQKNIDSIVSSINSMKEQRKSRQITKIEKSGFGKVTVQIQIQRFSVVQKTYKFLSTLPQQIELSFINNYFSCSDLMQREEAKDVIIQLAIRRQELLSYLESNSQCISFSTKLRILSQLISSAYLLENKCSTTMTNVGMGNFSIAKNMMVKLNHLEYLKNLTEEEKTEFQHEIKMGFVQNQVNISRIYSKLFYQKELMYFKPSKNANKLRLSHVFNNSPHEEKEVVIDQIYEQCGFYGPKKLMALLTCIFIPYIPMVSFEQIKKDPPCKNLKYGIASLIKILENID